MTNLQPLQPEDASNALLRRRRARKSLLDYAKEIDIPGKPVSEDPDEWVFEPVETGLAAHHVLMLNVMEDIITGKLPRGMFFMNPGTAKALALSTPIPTPSGWKHMAEIKVGDQVFGDDGRPCNVIRVSQVWKDRPCYEVKTDCGDKIIADSDHDWLVRLSKCPRQPLKTVRDNRGLHGMPDRDNPLTRFKLKKTHELCRRRAKRPMIKRAEPLELPDVALPIDPYLLGVWLGDGHSSGIRITAGENDITWMREEIERIGYKTSKQSVKTQFGVLGVRDKFVKLGLINDPAHKTDGYKHVPQIYMRSSIQQRKALLQGLIDTDGTICKRQGCATFCNTNRLIAESVRELARSLGVKAGWAESRAVLNGTDHGTCYKVSFYMKDAVRMPRKRKFCRDQKRTPDTYIEVTPTTNHDTVCIEVDSPSHLFLCGESMTPTHNSTYGSVVAPSWAMGKFPGLKIILSSYGSDLARKHGRRARQIAKSQKYKAIFKASISQDTSAADEWALTNGSEYMACGILSGITGNRAHGLIIDDPVKGRQEADSETIQARTWDVYQEDLRTRLIPGGWEIIIQTRWNLNDLSGKILPEDYNGESGLIRCRDGRDWYVLCLPAQCERTDDPLGRKIGDYIWPEWFGAGHFEPFKQNVRTWNALFQQRPQPEEGTYFQKDWFKRFKPDELPKNIHKYECSDYAVSENEGDYTEHGVLGLDVAGDIWVADWWYGQDTAEKWIDSGLDLVKIHKPFAWFGAKGVIKKAVEPFLKARMLERKIFCRLEWLPEIVNKVIKARAFQGMASAGKVHIPEGPIGDRIINQLLKFPTGAASSESGQDDIVDVFALFAMALEMAHPAIVPFVPDILKKSMAEARVEHIEKPTIEEHQYLEEELKHSQYNEDVEGRPTYFFDVK